MKWLLFFGTSNIPLCGSTVMQLLLIHTSNLVLSFLPHHKASTTSREHHQKIPAESITTRYQQRAPPRDTGQQRASPKKNLTRSSPRLETTINEHHQKSTTRQSPTRELHQESSVNKDTTG